MPARLDGEFTLPLIDRSHPPIGEKQQSNSPEKSQMIRGQIDKLLEYGVIQPSQSPWAAQVLRVKNDGTSTLRIDWCKINSLFVLDNGGYGIP